MELVVMVRFGKLGNNHGRGVVTKMIFIYIYVQ